MIYLLGEKEFDRRRAVIKRQRQIHHNSGYSNSWLRRLNTELEKLGKDITSRNLVKFIMNNDDRYETWDEIVEAAKYFIKHDEAFKKTLRRYRRKLSK